MEKINFTIVNPLGNITAFVETKVPKSRRSIVVKKIMTDYPTVEQVGFTVDGNLEMMADELSILGMLGFGFYLYQKRLSDSPKQGSTLRKASIRFKSSGIKKMIVFDIDENNYPMISFVLPKIKVSKINKFDFVDFGEIGYFVVPINQDDGDFDYISFFENFRERFDKKLNRNAWGVVFYKGKVKLISKNVVVL